MHISFIYYEIYVVLFAWLFTYKGPEICLEVFRQVSVLMIWCHYVAVLPPANRCSVAALLIVVSSIDTFALIGEHENAQ